MSETKSSLKIGSLIFGSLKTMGGYEIFTYNLLTRLVQRGHQVHLYIPENEYVAHKTFYSGMPFEVKSLFLKTKFIFKYAPGILRAYLVYQTARNKYDLWQIVGAYPAGSVADVLAGKVPLVLRTHGDDIQKDEALNYGMRLDPRLDARIRTTLHKMDRAIALTETVRTCYREIGLPEEKICEIPNGLDISRFEAPSDLSATRNLWNLPSQKPLLLTVGRYHPKKGYTIIPKVARLLKEKGKEFIWLIVGKHTEQLNDLIVQEGVTDVLKTHGEIGIPPSAANARLSLPDDKLIHLYQIADIFVFPSRMETFGRVLIEAMAAGLPVVTTDAPGCRDVVRHGETGLLSDPDDVISFAHHIQSLMEDDALRKRLVGSGRLHVKQYDWNCVVDRYEQLYRSLLPPRP